MTVLGGQHSTVMMVLGGQQQYSDDGVGWMTGLLMGDWTDGLLSFIGLKYWTPECSRVCRLVYCRPFLEKDADAESTAML